MAVATILLWLPCPAHAIKVRDLLRSTMANQPRPAGHFLTGHELGNISSVQCLEARQRDPTVVCEDGDFSPGSQVFGGSLSAGNYPAWDDRECNSNAAGYLCDPTQAVTAEERAGLIAELQDLRYDTPVTCGRLGVDQQLASNGYDQRLQPFYLGVALATGWPRNQMDPASLQWLGMSLIARWNMDQLFTGTFRPYALCPNSAMLIVLPDSHQAYLASESSEFISAERGGPEVVTAVLAAMGRSGTANGIRTGIREVYRILQTTVPISETPFHAPPDRSQRDSFGLWTLAQRLVFAGSILALAVSFVVAFLVLLLAPGMVGRLGKRGEPQV